MHYFHPYCGQCLTKVADGTKGELGTRLFGWPEYLCGPVLYPTSAGHRAVPLVLTGSRQGVNPHLQGN